MMRKGAKHRVGGAVRERERERERRKERSCRGERGGGAHGGKIRGRAGRTEGEKGTGKKKGRDVVTVGGGGSGCILPAQPAGTNKRA